jgi:hypothetical protein
LLPVREVVPFLQRTLKLLSLNVKARTEFITYWLPRLQRPEDGYVALRFLPQPEYSAACPLSLSCHVDAMTRIFLLFKGVKAEEAMTTEWTEARSCEVNWMDVVGVQSGAFDASLVRVLEWCVRSVSARARLITPQGRHGSPGLAGFGQPCLGTSSKSVPFHSRARRIPEHRDTLQPG